MVSAGLSGLRRGAVQIDLRVAQVVVGEKSRCKPQVVAKKLSVLC